MIRVIAAKELRALLASPIAWVVAALVQALAAYFFIIYLDYFLEIQDQLAKIKSAPGLTELVVSPLYVTAAIIFLILTPVLTMRLVSEERNKKTLGLLLSAPLSMTEIVLGKFIGVVGFVYTLILLLTLMPLSLLFATGLDYGLFFSSLVGALLVTTSVAAAGLFMSTLTTQPVIALIGSWGLLLFLWIIELQVTTGQTSSAFAYISMLHHYTPMMQGRLDSTDVAYYLLFIVMFIVLSIRRLDAIRWAD